MKSIDVVIPVLNDAEALRGLLISIHGAAVNPACEMRIYVVDGGSSDDSITVAESANATVLEGDGGRGPQLEAGCRAGTGEWILMLHADSYLKPDALKRLGEGLREQPGCVWGIMGHDYGRRGGLAAHWALVTNRLRFHLSGVAYGDQGIFIRREVLEKVGGVPELPLMEDVELSLRLRACKRISLGACLTASARRFEQGGWAYMLKLFRLYVWWLLARAFGAEPLPLSRRIKQAYYGPAEP